MHGTVIEHYDAWYSALGGRYVRYSEVEGLSSCVQAELLGSLYQMQQSTGPSVCPYF